MFNKINWEQKEEKGRGKKDGGGGDIFTSLWGDSTCHRFLTAWGFKKKKKKF